jgi:diguanylate cyclase (GGDEF)-like protein
MEPPRHKEALPSNRKLSWRISRPLLIGFAILIGLMGLLVSHTVIRMQSLEDRMRDIVEQRNHKIQLATDLLEASHNRHNMLVYQTVTEDPFERDEMYQLYIKWGYNVGKARSDLRAMQLDEFETRSMAAQDGLVEKIIQLHDEISDLPARSHLEDARVKLAVELRPLNLQMVEAIDQLRKYERDRIRESLDEAHHATIDAIRLNIGLGTSLILLALVIAAVTQRQLAKHARTINEQMHALEKAGDQLEHKATHDPLTGLANRNLFSRRLQEAIQHASQDNLPLTVLYIDLDDFKPINDQFGHAAGDRLLRAVASRLHTIVRTTDTVARLGGDEFAILLLGIGGAERIKQLKADIETAIEAPLDQGALHLKPACSVGYASFPADGKDMDSLLHAADSCMYEIKRARKGQPSEANGDT